MENKWVFQTLLGEKKNMLYYKLTMEYKDISDIVICL